MPGPEMIVDRPPEAFGLSWTIQKKAGDGRMLYIAAEATEAFMDAFRVMGFELRHLGYSRTEGRSGDAWTGFRPSFWMHSEGWSVPALTAYLSKLPTYLEKDAAERDRKARQKAFEAEQARRIRDLIPDARAAAAASLASMPWAWTKAENVAEAEALIAREDLDAAGANRLNKLTANAAGNVERATTTASTPAAAELALAQDPAIREACREAVALLTGRDSDRASERNASGWGRSTSILGHVLAGIGELDEAQASHALRILRLHRKQLPAELIARLFGTVAVAA